MPSVQSHEDRPMPPSHKANRRSPKQNINNITLGPRLLIPGQNKAKRRSPKQNINNISLERRGPQPPPPRPPPPPEAQAARARLFRWPELQERDFHAGASVGSGAGREKDHWRNVTPIHMALATPKWNPKRKHGHTSAVFLVV